MGAVCRNVEAKCRLGVNKRPINDVSDGGSSRRKRPWRPHSQDRAEYCPSKMRQAAPAPRQEAVSMLSAGPPRAWRRGSVRLLGTSFAAAFRPTRRRGILAGPISLRKTFDRPIHMRTNLNETTPSRIITRANGSPLSKLVISFLSDSYRVTNTEAGSTTR
jgi:hypothetical protein